ncbi:MAG: hypothetical protein EXS32_04210 [Opitutus sp.]|nr:hypothetical protein [Opitutus sp.]
MASLPQRQRLFHSTPPWVSDGADFFLTSCCAARETNQLATAAVFSVMTNALEHYVQNGKYWVHLFLAMPDHLHALVSFPPNGHMDKVIRDWKRFIAKQTRVVWQDGFFDHRLRDEENFELKAHYLRLNPVRSGLVDDPVNWSCVWPAHATASAR